MPEETAIDSIYKQAIVGVRILLYLKTKTNSLGLNTIDIDNLLVRLGDNPAFYETRKILDQSRKNNMRTMTSAQKMIDVISQDVSKVLGVYDKLFESFESRLKKSTEELYAIRRQ